MSSAESSVQPVDADAIRRIVADVLRVPIENVRPDSDLVYDLGAESIDFLDLLFSLDALVGARVLPERWGEWLRAQSPRFNAGQGITPRVIEEFIVFYRASLTPQPATGEMP